MKKLMIAALFSVASLSLIAPAMAQDSQPSVTGPDAGAGDAGPGNAEMEMMGRHGRHHGMGEGHGDRRMGEGRGHGGRGMQIIDANGDGVIGGDEAAAIADHMFARLDRDRNDELSQDEVTAQPMGWRLTQFFSQEDPQKLAAMLEKRKAMFTAADTDKNDIVTRAEFFVAAKARFAAADLDKDGKVTPWEFRSSRPL